MIKNTMVCPIKVKSNTIELTVHTSCYFILDLLCVKVSQNGVLKTLDLPENLQFSLSLFQKKSNL